MKTMLSIDDALALIRDCCAPLGTEQVPLADAGGRVLAAPVDAPRDLPPFANSAMDGFALRWHDGLAGATTLPVLAEQAAGDGIAGQSDGACSIMTGARIPDGLDTVVPVEDCRVVARDGEGRPLVIALAHAPARGQHVRHAGEDVAAGERVLEAGTRLDEEALLVLRGIGIGTVAVHRRPRLALACTGRELVDTDGAALAPGQIANTNGPYLQRLFADAGAEVVERVTLADEPDAFATWLARWLDAGIELVVTTGAVTLSFVPYATDLQGWINKARAAGHEVLLELPMEAYDYPNVDTGPQTLITSAKPEENLRRLNILLGKTTGYFGVTNYQGAKFATDAAAATPVMKRTSESPTGA